MNVVTTAATSKYTSPSPLAATHSDHAHAAMVPTEMSVSIVAAPWRRWISVAR